ncbi:hypothetical protein QTG54_014116 [Skeletonema marinoi]|uniref:Uncharacterized protein n=1 Tax=Skeletonema marinoi TaxID=267567 RepID=A0AAD8XWZ4_9STRA|nr:hypothetical protein QTG54_014116 [Skeletonema marinoi]
MIEYSQYPEAANDSIVPDGDIDFDAYNPGEDDQYQDPPPVRMNCQTRTKMKKYVNSTDAAERALPFLAIAALAVGSTLLVQKNRSIEDAQQTAIPPVRTPSTNTNPPTNPDNAQGNIIPSPTPTTSDDGATGSNGGNNGSELTDGDTGEGSGSTSGSSTAGGESGGGSATEGDASDSSASDGSGTLPGDLLGGDIIDGSPTSSPKGDDSSGNDGDNSGVTDGSGSSVGLPPVETDSPTSSVAAVSGAPTTSLGNITATTPPSSSSIASTAPIIECIINSKDPLVQSVKKHAVERHLILSSVIASVDSGCAGPLMHATDLTVRIQSR